MITLLIRYFMGFVKFRVYSATPERFFTMALSHHIKLSKIKKTEDGAQAYVSINGYKALARSARSVSAKLRVLEKHGVPFIIYRHRKRIGIYVGAVFFVAFLTISQNFIWEIKLPEYDIKKSELLLQNMKEEGIFVGAFTPSLNMKILQSKVLTDSDDLSWIAFNMKGAKLYVELAQVDSTLPIEADTPCNIIARKTGQITAIEEQHGVAVVHPKEVVLAGELLISGTVQKAGGIIENTHAAGRVMAQTVQKHSISFDFNQIEKNYGEIKNRYSLDLFGLNVPLYIAFDLNSEYDIVKQKIPVNFFSQNMPYGIKKDSYHLFTMENKVYDEEQAIVKIEKAFQEFEKSELNDAKILGIEQSQYADESKLTITKKYLCEENIAQQAAM